MVHQLDPMLSAALDFASATTRLTKRIQDPQSIATLFKFCTLPSIAHLLAADVLHHTDPTSAPVITSWSSPLTTTLQAASSLLLQHVTNTTSPLPALSLLIAHLPLKSGGLGFRDHTKSALPAFLIPLLRSIRYATSGIPYRNSEAHHKLPTIYAKTLSCWHSARHPPQLIQIFRHYIPAFTTAYNGGLFASPHTVTPHQLVLDVPTKGLQSRLYTYSTTQAFLSLRPTLDASVLDILPSLLSPLTGIPLHSLPRRFKDHRFSPDVYRLLLRRKLRLQLFDTPDPPSCPFCTKTCDCHGDHLFSCGFSKRFKPTLHNHIRDTLFTILQQLAPLANLVRTKHDIQREPSQRIPDQPTRRPLDVSIDLLTPTHAAAITIGIDVTIPHVSSALAKKSHPSIPLIMRTHLASIRSKFQGRTTTASSAEAVIQSLNAHHIALIPFTVDHLGGLGPFAATLLFTPSDSPITQPPPTPITAFNFQHRSAEIAHDVALDSSLHVAHHANREWSRTHPTTRFGQTYHTMTPQQWSLQSLSLNISHGLGQYLQGALTALSHAKKSSPTSPPRTIFYGPTPFSFRPHVPVLTAAAPPTLHTFHTQPP